MARFRFKDKEGSPGDWRWTSEDGTTLVHERRISADVWEVSAQRGSRTLIERGVHSNSLPELKAQCSGSCRQGQSSVY